MHRFDKRRHIGLMAQDLQHVVPEAVIPSEDGDFLTVETTTIRLWHCSLKLSVS